MTTTQPSAPEVEPRLQETRQIRRSRRDHVFGGVCGGLGQYFGVDPLLLRVAFVAIALAGGSGVLLYIIAWIAIPEAAPDEDAPVATPRHDAIAPAVVGGGLVLLGILLLVGQVMPGLDQYFWPLLLVAVGATLVLRGEQR